MESLSLLITPRFTCEYERSDSFRRELTVVLLFFRADTGAANGTFDAYRPATV